MGNCQAAEAATVVIQHPGPGKKIQRIYWSVSANEIMGSNPGHYVALLLTSPTLNNENGTPVKQLKLLKPHDTLLIGHVYRLVSFQDVLKEFAANKCVKLGKLLKQNGGLGLGMPTTASDMNQKLHAKSHNGSDNKEANRRGSGGGGRHHGGKQWRPALQSIAEIGI